MFNQHISLKTFTLVIVVLLILIIAHAGRIAFKMDELGKEYYEIGQKGYRVLNNTERLDKLLAAIELNGYEYLLAGDVKSIEVYRKAIKEINSCLGDLNSQIAENTASYKKLQSINDGIKNLIDMIELKIINKGNAMSQQYLDRYETAAGQKNEAIRADIDQLQLLVEQNRSKQLESMNRLHRQVLIQIYISTIILFVIVAYMGYIVLNRTRMMQKTNEILADREKRLEIYVEELQGVSQLKSEFLANMSHELRTPLNAVIGFARVLQKQYYGALTGKQSEYVNYIENSGQHLLCLINDILDVSKIEAGKMELQLSKLPLHNVLENSLAIISQKALQHHIDISMEVEEGTHEIIADELKLKQILYNLLSNAVKFTPDGGWVRLKAGLIDQQQGKFIEISVADNGIGIPISKQEKIFEPFTQLDGSYTRKQEGTGLGLSLVKRLVELHGGRTWVESAENGKGSTFYFTLKQEGDG